MKNSVEKYITIEEASRRTNVPVMRIVSLIVLNKLNGILVSKETGVIQESELRYLK